MSQNNIPTKGNLINIKKSLSLAENGYNLLDKKRNVLTSELMILVKTAKGLRGEIEFTYKQAYTSLQYANISLGICENISKTIPIENNISLNYRSIMGIEIPEIKHQNSTITIPYGYYQSNSKLDHAYLSFQKVKDLTIILSEADNSIYKLAHAIKKTKKRANSLKNIIIPKLQSTIKFISEYLEEKDREEFSRLKVIKSKTDR